MLIERRRKYIFLFILYLNINYAAYISNQNKGQIHWHGAMW